MKTIAAQLAVGAFLLASSTPLLAATITFGGTFNVPLSQEVYDDSTGDTVTIPTNDSFFGSGGSVPYTVAITYNAPASPNTFFAEGGIYDPSPGVISPNPSFTYGEDLYGYTEDIIVGVTVATPYGSYTFTPGVDRFAQTYNGNASRIWFDTDISAETPSKAFFRVSAADDLNGFFGYLEFGQVQMGSLITWPANASLTVLDVPEWDGENADYIVQSGYSPYGAVPEPSGMMLAGLAATLGMVRRNRAA